MLVAGEIQFFTLMGGLLGAVVPVAEIQQVPFAFKTAPHAHQVVDGALGAYIREEMAAKGIHGFPVGAFDNGMRQITPVTKPIVVPADLKGMRMRVPAGADVRRHVPHPRLRAGHDQQHRHLRGAQVGQGRRAGEPARARRLVQAVRSDQVRQHDQPHVVRLQPDGAPAPRGAACPPTSSRRSSATSRKAVRLQREDQEAANGRLRAELTKRGLIFNDVDQAPFRRQLSGFYKTWKEKLGTKAWALLEQGAGATLT